MQIEHIEYVPLISAGFKRFIRINRFNSQFEDGFDTEDMADDYCDFAQLANAHECFFSDPYWYDGECKRWNIWRPLWLHIGEDACRDIADQYTGGDDIHYEEFWKAVCDCYFGRTTNYNNAQ